MAHPGPDPFSVPPRNENNPETFERNPNPSKEAYNEYIKERNNRHSLSWFWPLIIVGAGCLVYYFVHVNDHILPAAVTKFEAEENPALFSGERSRTSLRRLVALGPRVVGDVANEVDAPRVIIDEIIAAQLTAHPEQHISYERQKGSGAYTLGFKPPFTNIYDNIQNVIVKIEGSEGDHSILVNCHYDSLYQTDGASDDAVNCAVMMELMRVLSKSPTRLRHNVVLLFNGAEEVPLQGSHLFLQHRWSKDVRVFLNLEAAGIGGRSILFQVGPKNSWLFKYYAKSAPHPHGQIMGEDLFQSGLIPSDSDFRIFRDFGKMPGLDFAFCRNGHIYHTLYDSEAYIPIGSHQHMGDNILALLNTLGNADELKNVAEHSEGQMVYYDYLGWFMISYTAEGAIAMNTMAVIIAICSIVVFVGRLMHWHWLPFSDYKPKDDDYPSEFGKPGKEPRHNMHSYKRVLFELAIVVVTRIISLVAAVALTAVVGYIIDVSAALVMPWYSNMWLIFPLFWVPFLVAFALIPFVVDKWRMRKHGLSLSLTTQMNLIGCQIIWIVGLFLLTSMGLRSASMFFVPVLFFTISNLVTFLTPLYLTVRLWMWTYLLIHLPAFLMNCYLGLIIYIIFIPVLGRTGVVKSDLIMAVVTCLVAFLISSLIVPLTTLVKKPILVFGTLTLFSIVMIIISLTTKVGQPYQMGPCAPKVQRFWIMHTFREYRDENQDVRLSESGYFVLNLDPNSPETIPPRNRQGMRSLSYDCDLEPYCGVPLYMTRMVPLSPGSSWIPAGMPIQPHMTELSLVDGKKCDGSTNRCTLNFLLIGPDRFTLTFLPRPGATLVDWSVPTEINTSGEWHGRPTYYLHIVRGEFSAPYEISLTFEVTPAVFNSSIVDIGLGGNHVHHVKDRTTEFQGFLDSFPDWTHRTGWISAYKSYVF